LNSPKAKRKFSGIFSFASVLIVSILVLITWNVFQLREKTAMQHTIYSLKQKLVYTDDLVIKNSQNKIVEKELEQSKDSSKIFSINGFDRLSNNVINKIKNEANLTANKSVDKRASRSSKTSKDNSVEIPDFTTQLNERASNITPITKVNDQQDLSQLLISNNYAGENTITLFDSINIDSVQLGSQIELEDCDKIAKQTYEDSQKKESVFSNSYISLGIGNDIANHQQGYGAFINFHLNKKWSLNTGLKFSRFGGEKFNDEIEFRREKDRNFRNDYPVSTPDSNMLSNIDISYNVIQVPLYVNYQFLIGAKSAIVFSFGSDLDIHAKENVHFHPEQANNGIDVKRNLNVNTPVLVFNNATLSVGVEKNFKRFSIQLSPFISQQITAMVYRKETNYYGAKLRMVYTI
jgi:hypothetical protein